MIIAWNVRCFSRANKDFFNRHLVLDTASLDPITRSRVEMCLDNRDFAGQGDPQVPAPVQGEGGRQSPRTS